MPGWGLILSIPTPGVTAGRLCIDVGGRLQKIDLAHNQAAARQVVANPSHDTYRIVDVTPKFGPLDGRLIKECDGLRRGCTAFGHLTRVNKLIRRATEIFAGQDYVLVWHSNDTPTIPERFDAVPISPDMQWEGAIISVPRHLDEAERLWMRENIGPPIKNALPTIVPIWPPLCDRRTSQLLEATSHPNFLFYVDSLEGPEAALFLRTMGQDQVLNVHNVPTAIFRVPSNSAHEFKIVARARDEAQMVVSLTHMAPDWQVPGITLTFDEGEKRSTLSMCDSRIATIVGAVRRGDATLVSSDGPKHCKVTVRERRQGLWIFYREVECEAKEIAVLLTSIFEWNSRELQFDFGAYGHLLLNGICPTPGAIQLSSKLRKQILGYLFQFPRAPSQAFDKIGLDDDALIAAFRRIRPTKRSLTQHVALEKFISASTA
jgi:hypothetical protein